jgi:uncharacterized membrane protein
LVLGVFFRFVNLDQKVYWEDEAFTSLRISGYTWAEVVQQDFNGRVIGIEDLQKYQRPNLEKSWIDTVKSLAIEDSPHPPLYYLIARFWVQWLGNSVAVTRSLSAVLSLLAFPCIYWLCLELFESPLVGWVAMALIAVSPFHVLYAQEAREYSFWIVIILLSSATLLQAMRLNTRLSWGMYAVSVAVGLYVYPFTGLVVIGHGIYIAVIERFRVNKTVTAYLLASLVGLLAFVPWIVTIIVNLSQAQGRTTYTVKTLPLLSLVGIWVENLSRIFLDVGLDDLDSNKLLTYWLIPVLILLVIVVYSIYFLCRHTPKRVWLFILTGIGIAGLALVLPDLILGGRRSSVMRYVTPCYLGIQLAVAFLLASKITYFSVTIWRRRLWQVVMVTLISCGVLSCAISSQAEAWWNKGTGDIYLQVASIINQANYPLVISDSNDLIAAREVSLSYRLAQKVRFLLVVEPNLPKIQIPEDFSDLFVFDPSQALQEQIEQLQNRKLEPVHKGSTKTWLWRVEK